MKARLPLRSLAPREHNCTRSERFNESVTLTVNEALNVFLLLFCTKITQFSSGTFRRITFTTLGSALASKIASKTCFATRHLSYFASDIIISGDRCNYPLGAAVAFQLPVILHSCNVANLVSLESLQIWSRGR